MLVDIREEYKKYANIDIGNLTYEQMQAMRNVLSKTKSDDLHTLEEHKIFIDVLHKFRKANVKYVEFIGANFLDTIKSIFAVGEDGVYSNSQRFIYELIQNVDDCEYEDIENCRLTIRFNYSSSPGKIIFEYNEKGFKPENVFAITGIAEKSKNISADKVEIGEKGIGFKSVFGVADKVYIESGYFSFELYRDDYTVPVSKYDDYTPVKGTRLTLEMPAMEVKQIYRSLIQQYMNSDALLNQNPILFLNKLTYLKMYVDDCRCIEFNVERKKPEIVSEDIKFENDVLVIVDMKDYNNGMERAYSKIISCRRYTQPIVYGEKECKSRYGEKSPFIERRHNLIALFPEIKDDLKNYNGLMYSFLPTQIQTNAPIVMHVPFKLDSSREFVDPQGENLWFRFTIGHLASFLKQIYIHLASIIKQDVITYIPQRHNSFFKRTSEKIMCLQKPELSGDAICMEKIFYTADGSYENIKGIVSFAKSEEFENPKEILPFLGETRKLFIPNTAVDMQLYGAKVLSDVPAQLFRRGLQNANFFNEVARILDTAGTDLKYAKIIEECCPLMISKSQLLCISEHKAIYNAFNNYAVQCIKDRRPLKISFTNELPVDEALGSEIKEITPADLNENFVKYLNNINYKFFVLQGIKDDFSIAGKDGIVLARSSSLGSFGRLVAKFDDRKVFASSLQIRQASNRLNEADVTMPDSEYLKLLRDVRLSLKNGYNKRMYDSYVDVINQAGMDENRFLNELLQNADDCKYPSNEMPTFDLKINGDIITVTYNEIGFSKQNVRAITAIGESTKKLLQDGKDNSIGEKGVGFKSVFGVAKSVEIHSNNFDFKLTNETPTIPDKCKPLDGKKNVGTTLIFSMKKDIRQIFEEERILCLCLCLRKLKRINILDTRVIISDSENERTITIGNKSYHFEKITYDFSVEDDKAIAERNANYKAVSKRQKISCYIPKNYRTGKYYLYVGLPTVVECNIPLIIDAPFELTTSRENVIKCRWNDSIKKAVYGALSELMYAKREELRIDIFKYVKFNTQSNNAMYQTFSDDYLNDCKWIEELKVKDILPVMNVKDSFVSAYREACVIVPDMIAYILTMWHDRNKYFKGTIIDTYRKGQFNPLLENIGCKKSNIKDELDCVQSVALGMITNEEFRKVLYSYLTLSSTQERIKEYQLYDKVKNLPIFPIRTVNGVEYVVYSKKIYTHKTRKSDDNFMILETSIMEYEQICAILGGTERINELHERDIQENYRDKLVSYISSHNKTNKEKALYVLNEFEDNFINSQKCKYELKGRIKEIPMEMVSGNYKRGNKFVNKKKSIFSGETVNEFIVKDKFRKLAEFLECSDILEIHYSDIDIALDNLYDEDIDDIQKYFIFYSEILEGFIRDDIITGRQIEEFHLECFTIGYAEDDNEVFPGRVVLNLPRLRNRIAEQFRLNPNPYVDRQRIVREPKNPVNDKIYTELMYASENSPQKCFCQMCQRVIPKSYIERNNVQRQPDYGWNQMYLNLCLKCSKDYILFRNNERVWNDFIKNILEADVENVENVEVKIDNKSIMFTATHLAEIQIILELEKKDENRC